MEQSDHQHIYSSGIAHEMNEERRNMTQEPSAHRDKHKKAMKHSSNKDHNMQLSEQLTEQSTAHAETMKGFLLWDVVPSITTISNKGRRAMD